MMARRSPVGLVFGCGLGVGLAVGAGLGEVAGPVSAWVAAIGVMGAAIAWDWRRQGVRRIARRSARCNHKAAGSPDVDELASR